MSENSDHTVIDGRFMRCKFCNAMEQFVDKSTLKNVSKQINNFTIRHKDCTAYANKRVSL